MPVVVPTSGTVPVVSIVPTAPPAGWVPDKATDPIIVPNVHYVLVAPVQEARKTLI